MSDNEMSDNEMSSDEETHIDEGNYELLDTDWSIPEELRKKLHNVH